MYYVEATFQVAYNTWSKPFRSFLLYTSRLVSPPQWRTIIMTRPVIWPPTLSFLSLPLFYYPSLSPQSLACHPVSMFSVFCDISQSRVERPEVDNGCQCMPCVQRRADVRRRQRGSLLRPKFTRRCDIFFILDATHALKDPYLSSLDGLPLRSSHTRLPIRI